MWYKLTFEWQTVMKSARNGSVAKNTFVATDPELIFLERFDLLDLAHGYTETFVRGATHLKLAVKSPQQC